MSEEAEHPDIALLQKHLSELSEHFEHVHIFAGRHEPSTEGGTISVNKGSGNWNARVGQIHQWMIYQNENERLDCRENREKDK